MSYNLQALGATVEHLEKLSIETAGEVKNLGQVMARMEGHIETQSKQIDRLHSMMDSLMEKTASRKEVDAIEDRVDKLEKAPANEALERTKKIKDQLWSIAVGIIGLAGIGALIYAIADNILKGVK